MKFTNKFGLPAAFVRAAVNDPYDNGGADFSPSSLNSPPRALALLRQFKNEVEVDVSSRVASIIGQGAHHVAERAARPGIDLCEKRLFAKFIVDGVQYVVSAQVDLYETDTGLLQDWKTTKAYAFSKKAGGGKKPEWISQLNIGAELLRRNGHKPKALQIIAMLKDWSQREAGTAGMPESEVLPVEIEMWEPQKTVEFIENQIRAHISARTHLPLCTTRENWAGRRCGQWCDASSVCDQYQQALKTGLISKVEE